MTTNQITGNRPTERQIAALRNFKVTEETIQGLSKEEASQLLDKYIGQIKAKKKKPDSNAAPDGGTNSEEDRDSELKEPAAADLGIIAEKVRERLRQAKQIMKAEFNLPDEKISPDSSVLGEIVKQIGSEAMIVEIAEQKRQNIQLAKGVLA